MNKSTIIAALAVVLASAAPGAAMAQSPDRWSFDAMEARALLPQPDDASWVESAALECAALEWTLRLSPTSDIPAPAASEATLRIDGRTFAAAAQVHAGDVLIAIETAALGPLKNGLRLSVELGDINEARFSLRGSRVAIDAVNTICARPDMSAYTPVTFTPYTSYLPLLRTLRADDIEAFSVATASQPQLSAAMVRVGDGRRILFTRLCGSSWYFGVSGCNVAAHASTQAHSDGEERWRPVYETEGVEIHLDGLGEQDWPDIVTMPMRAEGDLRRWSWNGGSYALTGEVAGD